MTDFIINDHILTKECESLASDIFTEICADNPDSTADDLSDEMTERAYETADGHEWVIYHYKALMTCAHCNVEQGEQFLEDCGMPETPTINTLATLILYGEMAARIENSLCELRAAAEEAA